MDHIPFFGLLIIGDEILLGKRQDKHFSKALELFQKRGLTLSSVHFIGDNFNLISQHLRHLFSNPGVYISFGGIGSTPDDHTRQSAAHALDQTLVLHKEAEHLIKQRIISQGLPLDEETNWHRLNMGMFPQNAQIIPNPYNQIPGFTCVSPGCSIDTGAIHFLPGFPIMAWPMMGWVLDTYYSFCFQQSQMIEKSIIIFSIMESHITPLMERIESLHPQVKLFSLPSVDDPQYGRHIEIGIRGLAQYVVSAYEDLLEGLKKLDLKFGPELNR
ncbi:MAG: molybdopterin-binding protein [Gammaproteobacteria bacterium]|nr:molybdopterin-binding protein [Gammaproteobacteria bacterium]